ncbi:MAG: HAMP domain-containing sensor histidine kinase [Candidatus Omnitrophota bacterium]
MKILKKINLIFLVSILIISFGLFLFFRPETANKIELLFFIIMALFSAGFFFVWKTCEEKVKEAMKIKAEFISMVSHELRTPLTAIKEGISIVENEAAGKIKAEQKEYLSIARRNVDRLAGLINNVLDFQKLEDGKVKFMMRSGDINDVVREVYAAMRSSVEKKGLTFSFEVSDGLPLLKFDRDKIVQVITNLVSNALKFTDKGRIKIITAMHGKRAVKVSVEDTGMGMKEEDISKVFHKFEQIGDANERRTGGTGLGLAISKDIVGKHKGRIWAESELGQGAIFSFTLPAHSIEC